MLINNCGLIGMKHCTTCKLVARRDSKEAPFWDSFYRTDYWDVVHKSVTTLPGWLILVSRRHVGAIDELTTAEAEELGGLIHRTSRALKQVVLCEKTYVAQFAEHPNHPHVHFHIVPRMADIPEDHKGTSFFAYEPKSADESLSDAEMNDVTHKIKSFLT